MNARTPTTRAIAVMAALAVSIAASASEPVVTCNSCADCEAKLSSGAYTTVTLDTDILGHEGTCINLNQGESDLVFDCAGHLIDGDGLAINPVEGVSMLHGSGNSVMNCVITDFDSAIYLVETTSIVVENNLLSDNRIGIDLSNAHSNTITGNTIQGSSTGVKISNSDYNYLGSIASCDNFPWDIYLASGIDNVGVDNTCGVTYYWNDAGVTDCTFSCPMYSCGFEDGTLDGWSGVVGGVTGDFEH